MRNILICLLVFITAGTSGQNGITFQVETLSKPEKVRDESFCIEIWEKLILKDSKLSKREIKNKDIDFKYDIIAGSDTSGSMVNYGFNSFFNGMYMAYAEHRPFVISPDMVWLLINQGFARHVNANPEKLRTSFVNFSGKGPGADEL